MIRSKTNYKRKLKLLKLKWNGEIHLSDILTILTIVIAFIALQYQRKDLKTKVEDLKSVVDNLEKEKMERESLGLDLDLKRLNSSNYNLEYTVDQIKAIEQTSNQEYIESLAEINFLTDIILKNKDISTVEKENLQLFKEINKAKQIIYANTLWFILESKKFEEKFAPQKVNFKKDEEYLTASKKYNDTLQKHMNYLLRNLDSALTEPKKRLNETRGKLHKF